MVGIKVKHPKSTNFDDADDGLEKRHVKRRKLGPPDEKEGDARRRFFQVAANGRDDRVIPDSDAESDDELRSDEATIGHATHDRQTDIESALPAIKTDKEAIQAYEATRAAQEAEEAERAGLEGRLSERKWIRGKSSIYVDAFNLALETVLEDESHLFNEAELAVFAFWRELSYEAQYLYDMCCWDV